MRLGLVWCCFILSFIMVGCMVIGVIVLCTYWLSLFLFLTEARARHISIVFPAAPCIIFLFFCGFVCSSVVGCSVCILYLYWLFVVVSLLLSHPRWCRVILVFLVFHIFFFFLFSSDAISQSLPSSTTRRSPVIASITS